MDKARSQTLRYTHLSKNVLSSDETELYELANLAGVTFDPNVFKIIAELLHMNVAPTAIERMLKTMIQQQQHKQRSFVSSDSSDSRRQHSRTRHDRSRDRIK